MNSVRERALREVLLRLSSALAPIRVLRHPTVPIARAESPALLVFAEGDAIVARANDRVDRVLTIRCVAVTRGDDAFEEADRLLVAAHAALLVDPNLGGLVLSIRELDCEWDADDADLGAAVLPARYEIRYRTHAHDITQTG